MASLQPVRVPAELQPIQGTVLEDYVQARLHQLVLALGHKLSVVYSNVTSEVVEASAAEVARVLPSPRYDNISLENMHLQLVFRHDCLALGCLDPQCILCQHNPHRRCTTNFDRKYLVNDALKAKCGAIIRVELIDRFTGHVVTDVPELKLEMNILDGNLYQTKFVEARRDEVGNIEELNSCALLLDNKQQPLLVCGAGASNDADGRVVLMLQKGRAELSDLHVIRSSEALLSGRKPPFRLLVRAVLSEQSNLQIHHAVSEAFVVATRRTRTCGKADIPSIEDHVSKLEHMGRETVRKLTDLRTAGGQAGVQIEIPENCVQKVGEFKLLALRADQDGHLRQKLLHVLKLSKEKWDETKDHAMKAVAADNHMRAWYTDPSTIETGLLYTCRLGIIDLSKPVGLLTRRFENGEARIEATLMPQQTPAQRETVRQLSSTALQSWYIQGHPGWALFPMDSEAYLQRGDLVPSHPTDTPPQAPLLPPPSPAATPSPQHSPAPDVHMADTEHPAHSNPHSTAGPAAAAPATVAAKPSRISSKTEGPSVPTSAATSDISPFASTKLQEHVAQSTGNLPRGAAPAGPPPAGASVARAPGAGSREGFHPFNPFLEQARAAAAGAPTIGSAPLGALPLMPNLDSASWLIHSSLLGSLTQLGALQQGQPGLPRGASATPPVPAPNGAAAAAADATASAGPPASTPPLFDTMPSLGATSIHPSHFLQSADMEGILPDSFNFDKAGNSGNSLLMLARSGSLKMETSLEFPGSGGSEGGATKAEHAPGA